MTRTQEHLKKHDREIAGIRKLLLQGGKMIVKIAAAQKRTDEALERLMAAQTRTDRALERLSAAQTRTEQTLERLIRSLEKGGIGNGHKKSGLIN